MKKNKKSYILVINTGSSSVKASLFEVGKNKEVFHTCEEKVKNYENAIKNILGKMKKITKDLNNIKLIGHRVVHGGEKFTKPTVVTRSVLKELEKLSGIAPLHNPANIAGINACMKLMPKTKNIAVFDTAYFSTLSERAYLYAIPYALYEKEKIRKYGFHGTSHQYVANEAITFLKKKNLKIISCHLGNGVSVTGSIGGKAVDTSMGFTPLEGTPMGTRSGDIDPAIIFHLGKKMSLEKIHTMLESESGLKGLSEISYDMRDLRDAYFGKNHGEKARASRALSVYCYRIAKYIGSYVPALGGIDCIVFTATIGEKANYIRKWICEYLAPFGTTLDMGKNKNCTDPKKITEISTAKSKVHVLVIPTHEELQIYTACKTMGLLR